MSWSLRSCSYPPTDSVRCADSAFACAVDGSPDSVKSDINVHCVGNLVLKFWVKAIAKVVSTGKCEPNEYLACEACCKTPQGGYIPDCDYQDCHTKCHEYEYASLQATATAAITFKEESSFTCSDDRTVDYVDYWKGFAPAGARAPL